MNIWEKVLRIVEAQADTGFSHGFGGDAGHDSPETADTVSQQGKMLSVKMTSGELDYLKVMLASKPGLSDLLDRLRKVSDAQPQDDQAHDPLDDPFGEKPKQAPIAPGNPKPPGINPSAKLTNIVKPKGSPPAKQHPTNVGTTYGVKPSDDSNTTPGKGRKFKRQ